MSYFSHFHAQVGHMAVSVSTQWSQESSGSIDTSVQALGPSPLSGDGQ